ncbi:MAG: efflux RND transporter periplasmic adaptor subunit [Acetobacteraceae bacterium]
MSHARIAERQQAAGDAVVDSRRAQGRRWLRPILMVGGVVAVAVVALVLYLNGGTYVSTDDAYVQANKLAVSTDVSGIVSEVTVNQGEKVAKGQVLFRLDPLPFRITLDDAKANLAETAFTIAAMKQDYRHLQKEVASARIAMAQNGRTLQRDTWLRQAGGVPTANYEDARFRLGAAKAHVAALEDEAMVELAKLGGKLDLPLAKVPQYQAAAAKVAEAERELHRAVVRAPFAGTVTEVSKLQPGMYLTAGTAAFGLVSTEQMWVSADPKETQLTWVRPGDPVTVSVDTYPDHTWQGTVASISPAAGSEFSLLPAQNSSGNWVKVVQRIPLRIQLERHPGDPPLIAGMSVEASIDTGHHRTLSDLW